MTDAKPDLEANPMPIQKVVASLGDGEGTRFSVEHPAAPNVAVTVYRSVGGEVVNAQPVMQRGFVIFAFGLAPTPEEFIAVVIG